MNLPLPFGADSLVKSLLQAGGPAKDAPFELRAAALLAHAPLVLSFRGRERVNDLYRYRITFATHATPTMVEAGVYGQAACFTIKAPDHEPRIIQGVVSRIESLGLVPRERDRFCYSVDLVPKLWLLKRNKRNRIWEQRTPQEIVEELLAVHGISPAECRWRIRADKYPRIPFTYQCNETDYDFLIRICAKHGIHFFFEHPSGLLDELLPGAGAAAGALGAAASMIGGSVKAAVDTVGNKTKTLTILNFGDESGHTTAVKEMAVVNEAIGAGLKSALGAIGGDTLADLVADDPSDSIAYSEEEGAGGLSERIVKFARAKSLRAKEVVLRDFDTEGAWMWEGAASTKSAKPTLDFKVGAAVNLKRGVSVKPALRVGADVDSPAIPASAVHEEDYAADTDARFYDAPEERASLELERRRARYLLAHGESDCRRLGSGYRFTLTDHPLEELNGEYTLIAFDSEGFHPDYASGAKHMYRNSFRAIPSNVTPRPRRPRRRQAPHFEVATVIGVEGRPLGPQLRANKCAHVRVRFRWDVDRRPRPRKGIRGAKIAGHDDHRTCWIPVGQPMAGDGYGTQFIPREGMDVIVGFLGGESERPFLLTTFYHEQHLPPFADAKEQHKMGWRSRSRPGGGKDEYNEVSTYDERGKELLFLRAQRDKEEQVRHDRLTNVGHEDRLMVAADQRTAVGGDMTQVIGGGLSVNVAQSRTDATGAYHTISVGDDLSTTVDGNRTDVTHGTWKQEARSCTMAFKGDHEMITSGAYHRVTGVAEKETSDDTVVYGSYSVIATTHVHLRALESFEITVGDSRIEMRSDTIRVTAPKIMLMGDSAGIQAKNVSIAAKELAETRANVVRTLSNGASCQLDGEVKIDGENVHFQQAKAAAAAQVDGADPSRVPFTMTVVTPFGQPIGDARYHLDYAGEHHEGVTASDGGIRKMLRPTPGARVLLRIWREGYPESTPDEKSINWWDQFPPISTDLGALIRLRNLGYCKGHLPAHDPAELAAMKRRALQHFMRVDMGIEEPRLPEQEAEALARLLVAAGGH